MSESLYHITLKSTNRKTGPIAVVTSSQDTCPDVCPFKQSGCYANGGPLRLHWNLVSNGTRGIRFRELLDKLKELGNEKESTTVSGRRSARKKQ